MRQVFLLVTIAFTWALLGAALVSLAVVLMADEEPLGVVLVVLIFTGGLVFLGQWLLGLAEKLHAHSW